MPERLLEVAQDRRQGRARAVTAVACCHPLVLDAAFQQAREDAQPVLVEAGGEGQPHPDAPEGSPAAFRARVQALAAQAGLPMAQVLLGAHDVGPGPWRGLPACEAMARAASLAAAYAGCGFAKLRLDASMPCAGDPDPLPAAEAARRAAALALFAERARAGAEPVYVVTVPGRGGLDEVTRTSALEATLDAHQEAFREAGLEAAWARVLAVAAAPGIGFHESGIVPYVRRRALALGQAVRARHPWMFEADATDYQHPQALSELVEDGCGVLRVGPWLAYACREALFALEDLTHDRHALDPGWRPVEVRQALDRALRRAPALGPGRRARGYARLFSFRDRSMQQWQDPDVAAEVERLLAVTTDLPRQLLSLYLPEALEAVLDGALAADGRAIVSHAVRRVLGHYRAACGPRVVPLRVAN